MKLLLALTTGVFTVLGTAARAADVPPVGYDLREDFTAAESIPDTWLPMSGSWSASGGTYNSIAPAPTAMTIVQSLSARTVPYAVHARIFNQRGLPGNMAGVVIHFEDPLNYYEVVFDMVEGLGSAVRLRQVSDGVATTLTTGALNRNLNWTQTWIDLEVVRVQGQLHIWIDGQRVAHLFAIAAPPSGQVGLVTHNSLARFDNVVVSRPFGQQPFHSPFGAGVSTGWSPASGSWSATRDSTGQGVYQNTSVAAISRSYAPITDAGAGLLDYTMRSRMFIPSTDAGNLAGIFFAERAAGEYDELVFSPTGVAAINRVSGGVSQRVATGAFAGQANVWFDVKLVVHAATDGAVDVFVDNTPVFENVSLAALNPALLAGRGGLLTHFTSALFDNVAFDYEHFTPILERFSDPLSQGEVRSGTWDTTGGTLNSKGVGANDMVMLKCCDRFNFAVRGRVRNEFGNTGNLVGVVYNYQPAGSLGAGDYYEVVFSPTGDVFLNKVIQGVRQRLASGQHHAPPHEWFTFALVRYAEWTTVKVNEEVIFSNVYQAQLGPGEIGVITHFTRASFDNVSVTERIDRSYAWQSVFAVRF
ncbi:MAG TPA: hypothetical protein VJS12_02290 [Steroidobacteraceae bacterium]|nr:hypothetical protein [Steroidobacteraceae bacterium]